MPGWHDATVELREQGKIRTLGVIQEQHPERALLFMQWKGMDWPLLVDSLNLLEVPYVPITLLVDEDGRARRAPRLRSTEDIERFVRGFVEGAETAEEAGGDEERGGAEAAADGTLPVGSGAGPISTLEKAELERAIAAYRELLARVPEDPEGWNHFRLGVLLRARYDSPHRQPGDFQAAVDHWRAALERDPNNYIFRRRIQQYGPRLDKPYPFYDWVERAQREIAERGEEPVELTVLPGGAEIAAPRGAGEPTAATVPAQPDPEGRIHRDATELVTVETTVVPGTRDPGEHARPLQVHLAFRPDAERKVHWNNEAEGLTVWLQPPPGVTVEPQRITVPNPPETLSQETRRLDFEAVVTKPGEEPTIPGYALYYICEDIDGICLYRRRDLRVPVGSVVD